MENRKQVITVASSKLNSYGDLEFTDTEGNAYKVAKKKVSFFQSIQVGAEVMLEWSPNPYKKDAEYIYSATQTGAHYPPDSKLVQEAKRLGAVPVEPTPQALQSKSAPPKTSSDKMTKEDWATKDEITRKSIQRQTALKAAVDSAPEKTTSEDIIKVAKRFDKYLEAGE